jgi:hypothetical protein
MAIPKNLDPPKVSPGGTPPILNRYTTLPIALEVLTKRCITLLSPETWEDRNDAYYLERYRQGMKFRSVLAICFSLHRETFHHWRIFSSGSSGVCIEFDKNGLLKNVAGRPGFRHEKVAYSWISELKKTKPPIEEWPFLKRKPFEDEREYRITFESKTESLRSTTVPIDLASIRRVTLSPWIPGSVASSVIALMKRIDGCAGLEMIRSSLLDNAGWRDIIN